MMSSRGDTPPEIAAVSALVALVELVKNADIQAHIVSLREAETAERAAAAALDKKKAEVETRQKSLASEVATLIGDQQALAKAQAACKAREDEVARQRATFSEQKAALDAQRQALNNSVAVLAAAKQEFEAAKITHAAEHEAKAKALVADTDRQHRESEAAIQVLRHKADEEIRAKQAAADLVIAAGHAELNKREAAIIGREEEFQRERSRFSALLQG